MGHGKREHHSAKHTEHRLGKRNETEKEAEVTEVDPVATATPSIQARIRGLRGVSGPALEDLKTGVENAYGELRMSVRKVVSRYEQAMKTGA